LVAKLGCPVEVQLGPGSFLDRLLESQNPHPLSQRTRKKGWGTLQDQETVAVSSCSRGSARLEAAPSFVVFENAPLRTQIPCSFVTARNFTRRVEVDHVSTHPSPLRRWILAEACSPQWLKLRSGGELYGTTGSRSKSPLLAKEARNGAPPSDAWPASDDVTAVSSGGCGKTPFLAKLRPPGLKPGIIPRALRGPFGKLRASSERAALPRRRLHS
jgi:hypothetical protein